jgi:hypothetical protein
LSTNKQHSLSNVVSLASAGVFSLLDTQVPFTGDDAEDPILEATDKALATFSFVTL